MEGNVLDIRILSMNKEFYYLLVEIGYREISLM